MIADSFAIAAAWAQALANDLALAQFCQERFEKAPAILLGFPQGEQPGQREAPYVAVIPVKDEDGPEMGTATQVVLVACGFVDKQIVSSGSVEALRGFESARLFDQLVQDVLVATDYPPSRREAELANPGKGFFERLSFHEIDQDSTL